MPTATRQKSTLKGKLMFGLAIVPVEFVAITRSGLADEGGFRQVCPACATPTGTGKSAKPGKAVKVKQRYICPDCADHGPFNQNELVKAREIEDALYLVSPEQVAYVEEGNEPKGDMEVRRVSAAALDACTTTAGATYRLRPEKDASATLGMIYAGLRDFIGKPDVALIAEMRMRGAPRIYRFSTWRGFITVQELVRVENISDQLEDLTGLESSELVTTQLEASLPVEDFVPEEWADQRAVRTAALDADLLAGKVFTPPAEVKAEPIDAEAAALAMLGADPAVLAEKAKARPRRKKAA